VVENKSFFVRRPVFVSLNSRVYSSLGEDWVSCLPEAIRWLRFADRRHNFHFNLITDGYLGIEAAYLRLLVARRAL